MLDKMRHRSASIVASIWMGLILGVSFYAAPIKFAARDVAFEDLLRIGQVTFQTFTWVEFASFGLLVAASVGRLTRNTSVLIAVLGLMLLVQKFGVLPGLDAALNETVAGESSGDSNRHFLYAALDVAKLAVLFALSLAGPRQGN